MGRHVGNANHFQLLNHPAVYEQMHAWIERSREGSQPV
jgi:hypothetical protein